MDEAMVIGPRCYTGRPLSLAAAIRAFRGGNSNTQAFSLAYATGNTESDSKKKTFPTALMSAADAVAESLGPPPSLRLTQNESKAILL